MPADETIDRAWPSIALGLIAFTSLLQRLPGLDQLPVPLWTIGTAGTLIALLQSRLVLGIPLALLMFIVSLGIGLYEVPSGAYAMDKRFDLLATALVLVGGYCCIRGERARLALAWTVLVIGLVTATTAGVDAVGRLGDNTIATGRAAGGAMVVLMSFMLTGYIKRRAAQIGAFAVAAALFGVLVATGSRGPVLAVGLALAILVLGQTGVARVRRLLLVGVASAGGWFVTSMFGQAGAARIEGTLTGEISGTESREGRWSSALDAVPLNPVGIGWGNFTQVFDTVGVGGRDYPHNLLLEVSLEAGWIAGLVLLVLLCGSLVGTWQMRDTPDVSLLLAMMVFFTINAFVSGDVNDNRPFWVVLGCALAVAQPHAVQTWRRAAPRRQGEIPAGGPNRGSITIRGQVANRPPANGGPRGPS